MHKVAVLSRYKEKNHNFHRTLESYDYNIIVYNKHQGDNLLPNIGRESHTYISYILDHYNNLPDEVLFSQYDPLDHFHRKNFRSGRDQNHIKLFLNNFLYDFVTINPKDYDLYVRKRKIDWIKYTDFLFQNTQPDFLQRLVATAASINGVFRVSRQAILRHDISFYERALQMLSKHVNPDEGFYFERIWRFIFTQYGNVPVEYSRLNNFICLFGNNIHTNVAKERKDGAYGHICFYKHGLLGSNGLSFYQNPNEAFWTIDKNDTRTMLYIFNVMSGLTSSFDITNIDLDTDFTIKGDYYDYNHKHIAKDFFWLRPMLWRYV